MRATTLIVVLLPVCVVVVGCNNNKEAGVILGRSPVFSPQGEMLATIYEPTDLLGGSPSIIMVHDLLSGEATRVCELSEAYGIWPDKLAWPTDKAVIVTNDNGAWAVAISDPLPVPVSQVRQEPRGWHTWGTDRFYRIENPLDSATRALVVTDGGGEVLCERGVVEAFPSPDGKLAALVRPYWEDSNATERFTELVVLLDGRLVSKGTLYEGQAEVTWSPTGDKVALCYAAGAELGRHYVVEVLDTRSLQR